MKKTILTMKGWKVGTPMTYSEIDHLVKLLQDEIRIKSLTRKK